MPPPIDHPCLHLQVWSQPFFVAKHSPNDKIPAVVLEQLLENSDTSSVLSITKTPFEISIVGSWNEALPAEYKTLSTWRCIKIKGPMEFDMTGVINSVTEPLKDNKLPVFVVSTWDTDYVLVKADTFDAAIAAWKADEWVVLE